MRIYVITTIGFDTSLLDRFLKHYKKFRPKKILIVVNASKDSETYSTVEEKTKKYGNLCILQEWPGEFSEDEKITQEKLISSRYCKDNDWVVYADVDEFQYYPKNIRASIKNAKRLGFDYLEGRMIDRICITGELTLTDKDIPLEVQYPLGGSITKEILKGWDKKIVCAKMNRDIGGGRHVFINRGGVYFKECNTEPYSEELSPHSFGIEIHHFKWNYFTVNKLKKELTFKHKSLTAWRQEHERFLKYMELYNKINIYEPSLKLQFYGTKVGV